MGKTAGMAGEGCGAREALGLLSGSLTCLWKIGDNQVAVAVNCAFGGLHSLPDLSFLERRNTVSRKLARSTLHTGL